MPPFMVYLSGDAYDALKELSEATGIRMTEHARRAITNYLSGGSPYMMIASGSVVSGNMCTVGWKP